MYSMLIVLFMSIVYNADCSPLSIKSSCPLIVKEGVAAFWTGVYPPPTHTHQHPNSKCSFPSAWPFTVAFYGW